MKKILLATTILAATAGFASAEIMFTGAASMGVGQDGGGSGMHNTGYDLESYASVDLNVEFTGETDGGLTFGATFDLSAGHAYAFADDDGFSDEGGAFGWPEVYISGSFGKLSMNHDGYGHYHHDDDGDDQADAKYEGTFGDISVGVIANVEGDTPRDLSLHLGYAANNIAASVNYDDDGGYDASIGYTMGTVTATLGTDSDNVQSLELAYAAGNITASASMDTADAWDLSFGYAANGMAINASTDEGNAWSVDGSYDLGGGLSIVGGVNYS